MEILRFGIKVFHASGLETIRKSFKKKKINSLRSSLDSAQGIGMSSLDFSAGSKFCIREKAPLSASIWGRNSRNLFQNGTFPQPIMLDFDKKRA